MEMMQELLMQLCCFGLIICGIVLFAMKVMVPAWEAIRKFFSQQGVQGMLLVPLIVGLVFHGATKGYNGSITYDGGIKSGTTSNIVSNDTISIYWQRDISGGEWVPDSAAVYIDYRLIGDNSTEWGLLAQSTVGAGHWEGTYPDATNYDYNVWAYYIPPEPVHTNGVWMYKTLRDRADAKPIPLRARVEINGVAIATPKEKRKDFGRHSFRKLGPYLYEYETGALDWDAANNFYTNEYSNLQVGFCSSAYKSFNTGTIFSQYYHFGRNYDWLYDNSVEFVIHTVADGTKVKYPSVSVASLGRKITDEGMNTGSVPDKILNVIPAITLDGVNSEHLCCCMNVVSRNPSKDSGWTGTSLCALGAVRYALDNFKTASEAAAYLAENVYIPQVALDAGYSFHFMLADTSSRTQCYIVEDGASRQLRNFYDFQFVMTNFRIYPASYMEDYTRAGIAQNDPNGSGYERWKILKDIMLEAQSSSFDMLLAMQQAWFTIAYDRTTIPPFPRPTEFAGMTPQLHIDSPDSELRNWASVHVPEKRTRGDGTWHTVHTCDYDMYNCNVKMMIQEDALTTYNFNIQMEN